MQGYNPHTCRTVVRGVLGRTVAEVRQTEDTERSQDGIRPAYVRPERPFSLKGPRGVSPAAQVERRLSPCSRRFQTLRSSAQVLEGRSGWRGETIGYAQIVRSLPYYSP